VVAELIDSIASRSFTFATQVMQSMSRLPKSLHSRWLPSAKIYGTDHFPRRMDRKTVHLDRKLFGSGLKTIRMDRKKIDTGSKRIVTDQKRTRMDSKSVG
jgi:hypothetical protein